MIFLGFSLFVAKKDANQKDITGEGDKIKLFLSDINYNRKRGDIKSIRMKRFIRIETRLALPGRNPRHHTVNSSSEETAYESGEETRVVVLVVKKLFTRVVKRQEW